MIIAKAEVMKEVDKAADNAKKKIKIHGF